MNPIHMGHSLTARLLGVALVAAIGASGAAAQEKSGAATLGFSGWSMGYLPTAITIERLNEMGYEIEAVELGGNANQLQAAVSGQIDITAIAQLMDAIDQGFNSRFFMGANTNEFVMVGLAGLDSCASLDGKRVGIHSVSSFVGQLAIQWFEEECPEAEPNLTVIEGSENRLAALLAGQLDASPVDLQDYVLLTREAPDKFVITEDFTETVPILRAAFAATPEFVDANEALIKDWIRVHLNVYQEIYDNPDILVQKAGELLPEIDQEALPEIVDVFVEARVWPVDGDLSEEAVQATIDFFNSDGEPFDTIESAQDVIDRDLLEEVLAE